LYQVELLSGWPYCYKGRVATATHNVHLTPVRRRLARPRNGDLDFWGTSNDTDLSRQEVRATSRCWFWCNQEGATDLPRVVIHQV